MLTKKEFEKAQKRTIQFMKKAGIVITKEEEKKIEIVDHNLGADQPIIVNILVYVNNDIYCGKELILFPGQIVPQHRHPPVSNYQGKQETFRCRSGVIYLYVPGKKVKNPKAKLPENKKMYFTVWNEIILKPGDMYTLPPNTWHWFQSGKDGAIVSEFSSKSMDEHDIFVDPAIKRETIIK